MTSPFPSPMDALEGLLEERKRYNAWLAKLEERRGNSPSHVLDRVRSDYEERLQAVLEQLRSRASDLENSASAMQARIRALLDEETARRDERAEAELRALVGEFTNDYAGDLLARCDDAIGRLAGERGAIETELRRVQETLALVRQPAEGRRATAAPAEPPAPEPVSLEDDVGADGSAFDELAFLQSVVQPRPAPPAPGVQHIPTPLGGTPRTASESAAPMRAEQESGRITTTTPSGVPSFLKDVPTEQVKTLKCQECGTMNYPTEWYCERCGGELAAM